MATEAVTNRIEALGGVIAENELAQRNVELQIEAWRVAIGHAQERLAAIGVGLERTRTELDAIKWAAEQMTEEPREHGLSVKMASVFAAITNEPCRRREIAKHLNLRPNTVDNYLLALRNKGLIRKVAEGTYIRSTPA